MIYLGLVLFLFVCMFVACFDGRHLNFSRNKKLFLVLFFGACALVMGFRGESVGVDTSNYARYFEFYKNTTISHIFSSDIEIGYAVLMKLCSMVCGEYIFFQMVVSAVYCYCIAKFIYDNSKHVEFASLLFLGMGFYLAAFNITRQYFAIGLLLNSWTLLINNKPKKSFALTCLAVLMHSTAIIFVVAYIVYFFRHNKYIVSLIPVFIIICAGNYRKIVTLATNYFFSPYFRRYSHYYLNNSKVLTAGYVKILWLIILVFAVYVLYKKASPSKDRLIGIFCIIYMVCNVIGLQFSCFERAGLPFAPFALLLFETVGEHLKTAELKYTYYIGVCTCFLVFFLLSALTSQQYQYVAFWNM